MSDEDEVQADESVTFVEVYFQDGPLGVTLRRNVETGTIHVFEVVEDSQAADGMDVRKGDELWTVGSVDINGNYLDKEAWEGLIQFIRDSDRPLKVIWKRITEPVETVDAVSDVATYALKIASVVSSPSKDDDDSLGQHDEDEHFVRGRTDSDSSSSKATADEFDENGENFIQLNSEVGSSRDPSPVKPTDGEQAHDTSAPSPSESKDLVELKDLLQNLVFTEAEAGQPVKKLGRRISSFFTKGATNLNTNAFRDSNSLLKDGRHVLMVGDLLARSKPPSTMTHQPSKVAAAVAASKHAFKHNHVAQILSDITTAVAPIDKPFRSHHMALLSDIIIISSQMFHMTQSAIDHVIELSTCKLRSYGQISETGFGSDTKDEDNQDYMFEILWPGGALELNAGSKKMREVWVLNINLAVCECIGLDERTLGWRHQYMLGTIHSAVLAKDEVRVRELLHLCQSRYLDFLSIECADEDGYTPMHYAAIHRVHNIMSLLHDATVDITALDPNGLTPLHWAALQLDDYALSVLTSSLIDADVLDQKSRTPLYLACVEGRSSVTGYSDPENLRDSLSVLLAHKPEVNGVDSRGYTLLQYLASNWQVEAVEQMLEAGADVMATNAESLRTALHFAARAINLKRGVGEGIRILRQVGVSVGGRSSSKNSKGKRGSVSYEESSDSVDSKTNSSLAEDQLPDFLNRPHAAATMQALLRAGALPNQKDKKGRTALDVLMESFIEHNRDREETPRKSLDPDDVVIAGSDDDNSDEEDEYDEGSSRSNNPPPEEMMRTGWTSDEVLDAVTVLISHGARVDEASPVTVSFRNKLPAFKVAYLMEKWNAKPVVSSELLDLRLKQWEYDNTIPLEAADHTPGSPSQTADSNCRLCGVQFSFFKYKRECKICDVVCCDDCSKRRCMVESASQRTCDCCYNRLSNTWEVASERAVQKAKEQSSTMSRTNSSSSNERARKDSLFGTSNSSSGSPSAANSSPSDHSSSMQGTIASMNDTRDALHLRGEKLAQTADKAQKVADNASEFAKMAKQLNDQQKKRWF
jgi:ankyrin repeat protein